jgi:hypothetical protein
MPQKAGRAIAYALLIWIIGFIWGSIVFMTPSLKSVAAIPYVSSNPAISFPILITWLVVSYLLSRSYLSKVSNKVSEGLKLGITFSVINIILDLVVLVMMLKAGFGYFASLTVWVAYLMLLIIPWITGRSLEKTAVN